MKALLAIVAGAALLAWPVALNGYPLVFIDTVSYLGQTVFPETPWDKSQAYGLFLHAFHWRVSLWPVVAAQALIASHLVWLAQRMVRGGATLPAHLLACALLAALTAAPWTLATLMPDALTAIGPLSLLLLGFARLSRIEAAWVALVGAVAIASHLSHLPTALAMLALVALLTWRIAPVLRAALPFALAIGFLLGANLVSFGRATLSPHGSVFLLARLQDDGPAAALLRERCPGAGWHLCAFTDRLPMDSDEFLWSPDSPLNRNADGSPRPMGGVAGSAEARAIVAATLGAYPMEVARAMLRNAARQVVLTEADDTLVNDHLDLSARRAIAAGLPRELAAFDAAAQMRGELAALAAPFLMPHRAVLILSLLLLPWLAWQAIRARNLPRIALLAGALVALGANAAATGALSKPHDRYQARIVWLLPLAVFLAGLPTHTRRIEVRHAAAEGGPPPMRRAKAQRAAGA